MNEEAIAELLYERAALAGQGYVIHDKHWVPLPWHRIGDHAKGSYREDAVAVAHLIRETCNDTAMDTNPGERLPSEFSFEDYVQRQFCSIHRRLDSMSVNIAGLEVEESTLATVVPELATLIGTLNEHVTAREAELTTKVTELTAKEAEVASDAAALATVKEELAKAQGELTAVEAVQAKLAPVVSEAEKLVPAPAAPAPAATEPAAPSA